jgi:hypothetical protein
MGLRPLKERIWNRESEKTPNVRGTTQQSNAVSSVVKPAVSCVDGGVARQ